MFIGSRRLAGGGGVPRLVPHIYVSGAADAIRFYTRAFGATELFRIAHPDGRILHGEPAYLLRR